MRVNYSAVADFRTFINIGKRHNGNIFAYFRRRCDISPVADNTFNLSPVAEQFQQCGKSGTRVLHADDRAVIRQLRVVKAQHHNTGFA